MKNYAVNTLSEIFRLSYNGEGKLKDSFVGVSSKILPTDMVSVDSPIDAVEYILTQYTPIEFDINKLSIDPENDTELIYTTLVDMDVDHDVFIGEVKKGTEQCEGWKRGEYPLYEIRYTFHVLLAHEIDMSVYDLPEHNPYQDLNLRY